MCSGETGRTCPGVYTVWVTVGVTGSVPLCSCECESIQVCSSERDTVQVCSGEGARQCLGERRTVSRCV